MHESQVQMSPDALAQRAAEGWYDSKSRPVGNAKIFLSRRLAAPSIPQIDSSDDTIHDTRKDNRSSPSLTFAGSQQLKYALTWRNANPAMTFAATQERKKLLDLKGVSPVRPLKIYSWV
jgi:hypothetical protein